MSAPLRAVPRRPSRPELEALIRETGGNMTALAERLGVTRQTAYTWIAQTGLRDFVGIREPGEGAGEQASAPCRVAATIRLDSELWKAARILAIEQDRTAGEIVEDALRSYLGDSRRGPC